MRIALLWIILLSTLPCIVRAQDDNNEKNSFWESGGELNANFQQVGLRNWAGGGQSTIALGGAASTYWSYDDTTTHRWENSLEIAYGISRIGNDDDSRFTKTKDNLIYTSRYGRKLSGNWYLSGLADLRTQIAQGFRLVEVNDSLQDERLVSRFMAPGFLIASLGLTYSPAKRKLTDNSVNAKKKEGNYFALSLSPFSGKFTFVLDEQLAERDLFNTGGEQIRAEAGASMTLGVRGKVLENVVFGSNLNLFASYEEFQNVDFNLESLLVLRVNKYIVSNISLQLIYDDDINVEREDGTVGPALQVQNAINVGFSYGF